MSANQDTPQPARAQTQAEKNFWIAGLLWLAVVAALLVVFSLAAVV